MEYISECCNKKIILNEQLKNVYVGFGENAILCCNSMFLEKNTGGALLRKKNVPNVGEIENVLSYHKIEFDGKEELNLLYLPNEIYDLKEDDFDNIALIKCRFNKKIKEDIQNEILEVTVLNVTRLSDFIDLYPLNYTGRPIESFEENNEILTIDKFGKWKCYISNIQDDLENWQITYTDDQNVEHCLIRGFWCMSDEDIASVGNVIYSEEENKKFWEDALADEKLIVNEKKKIDDSLKKRAIQLSLGGFIPTNELGETWLGCVKWKDAAEMIDENIYNGFASIFINDNTVLPKEIQDIKLINVYIKKNVDFYNIDNCNVSDLFKIVTYTSLDNLMPCNIKSQFNALACGEETIDCLKDCDSSYNSDAPYTEEQYYEIKDNDLICVLNSRIGGWLNYLDCGDYFDESDGFNFVFQICSDEALNLNVREEGNLYFLYNKELNQWKVQIQYFEW